MIARTAAATPQPVGLARLWFGLFGAPLAWSLEAMGAWALVSIPCAPGGDPAARGVYHVAAVMVCAVAVLVALASLRAAWTALQEAPQEDGDDPIARGARGRVRFMAYSGVFVSATFLLGTVLVGVGVLVVPPCA
jgi:hypothetical protein